MAANELTFPMQTTYTRRNAFLAGMKDTFPMVLGAIPFGIIFGALGVTAGMSTWMTMGMSLIVFAGSAQFIAVGLITAGASVPIIVLTTLIVNMRHALYAASLGPYMRHLSQKWLLPLGFWLTDETYAIVIQNYPGKETSPHKQWYHLGSSVFMYTNWQLCTLIGIVAGTQLEGIANWGLDFAMVVTFIGIIVPLVISRPMLVCAIVAAISAILLNGLPNKLGLMVASIIGIAAGVVAESLIPKSKAKRNG